VEKDINGNLEIHITVQTQAQEMVFVLDPAKNYAAVSSSVNKPGQLLVKTTFANHQLIDGVWIPRTISIEKYNQQSDPAQLLTHDYWTFNSVNTTVPGPGLFKANYEKKALVEYKSLSASKPVLYHYSDEADTEQLLLNKLQSSAALDADGQNCATLAIKHVADKFGKDVNAVELLGLVEDSEKLTSLNKLQQFTQQLDLYSACVKTDLSSLSNLSNCQIILHLQNAEHYVVVSHIDGENVWVIDLTSDKFYYNIKQEDFDQLWGNGVALLVSSSPINLQGNFTLLNNNQLQTIKGGSVPNYSCSDLVQSYDVQYCAAMCGGYYRTWYNRYGCEVDAQGGTCSGSAMVGNVKSHCIENIYDPGTCTITGTWYSQYMRACQ